MDVKLARGEPNATDLALATRLGEPVPDAIPLWPDQPPQFLEGAPPETVGPNGQVRGVTIPSIVIYPAAAQANTGRAILVCAGGGYGSLDWKTHVIYAAKVFNPMGVTIIGLRYRLRPPHKVDNAGIQALTLIDAQRALRTVRHRAKQWGIHPQQIGIAGYSAGGNLAMNLAANFDRGNPTSDDPIERESCRPDFAVGLATWHWRQKQSPFVFQKDTPPVFLVHATNDGTPGGAPIEMPRQIHADLKALGVPVKMAEFDVGAHGVGNLIPQRVAHGFPPAQWPQLLIEWLDQLPGAK
ncbi:MAG: alpha/beta hydrolase [Verrucomicrobiales bacterium]|nr:alpha/beta hydrolase [Verrucomicrobiales bacterium]